MKNIVKGIVKNKKTCYFVSPHLDDAAFSAGGLISYLAKKTKVVVVTIFTEASKDKHSLSALAYVKKCGYQTNEVNEFFTQRRKEDKQLFEKLGVEVKHLGFLDALWRKRKNLNYFSKFLSTFLNEFRYIYPTHRLHVAKGKVHSQDNKNLKKLEAKLKKIVEKDKQSIVFCPLGIGNHVDHIFVRQVCSKIFPKVIYWSDYIYNLYYQPNRNFIAIKSLKKYRFDKNQEKRKEMVLSYKTQTKKLFGGKDFNLIPETYYLDPTVFSKRKKYV